MTILLKMLAVVGCFIIIAMVLAMVVMMLRLVIYGFMTLLHVREMEKYEQEYQAECEKEAQRIQDEETNS